MWENLPLRTGHVIRRMRSGSKRTLMVAYGGRHSRTDERRIFKLGGEIDYVTRHI